MKPSLGLPRRLVTTTVVLVVLVACVLGAKAVIGPGTKHGVAYFSSVTSVYPHDKVRILGIPVGEIDKITPEEGRVRVDFSYSGKYDLPAHVKAAVVSPTLVATRFLQLAPAYTRGPKLADGAVIPESRTASPLEFDDLKTQLARLSKQLGPQGKHDPGALAQFLNVSAQAGRGRGTEFNHMITQLSQALKTLSEGRGDIFGTVRNLQVFIGAMAGLDRNMVTFNKRLAGVSGMLDDNGASLNRAVSSVDTAARLLDRFLHNNRPVLGRSVHKLSTLTTMLAASRDNLATALHVGPNALTNFSNIYSSRINAYTGALSLGNMSMGQMICGLVADQMAKTGKAEQGCTKYLGPLLKQVQINDLPVGIGAPIKQPQPQEQSNDPSMNDNSNPAQGLLGLLGGKGSK